MILSNVEIHRALDDGRLVVDPEPSPRTPVTGQECPYGTTAVDLRLGKEIQIPKENRAFTIDLREGSFADLVTPENYETKILGENQPYSLGPRKFVLGRTFERVALPIQDGEGKITLAARIEGRSSYARSGMMVHLTAPTIHADFDGTITLEIINLAPTSINLHLGVPVCQLIVEEVKGRPFRNFSQFQGQATPGGHS